MRITISIDEAKVRKITKLTGLSKKSPAVARAVDEFIEFRARKDFVERVMAGRTQFRARNDRLEAISDLETP